MRYFEVKVKYDRRNEKGQVKNISETYALAAQTFTDAEHTICEKANGFPIDGEFEVVGEKIANYDRFIPMDMPSSDSRYYEVKYATITIDEYTAKEKKEIHFELVEAVDVQRAAAHFLRNARFSMTDIELVSVKETAIIEVFDE